MEPARRARGGAPGMIMSLSCEPTEAFLNSPSLTPTSMICMSIPLTSGETLVMMRRAYFGEFSSWFLGGCALTMRPARRRPCSRNSSFFPERCELSPATMRPSRMTMMPPLVRLRKGDFIAWPTLLQEWRKSHDDRLDIIKGGFSGDSSGSFNFTGNLLQA